MRISLQLDMEELKLISKYVKLNKENRLYNLDIPIIGLTGGIATGKSTVNDLFKQLNTPVIDADELVHYIYKLPETVAFIQSIAPHSVRDNQISFKLLREEFFTKKELKLEIEKFIYSKLPQAFAFYYNALNKPKLLVYDIPLLFEKNLESKFDLTLLVYAPREMQISRLIERDAIDIELANKILDQQDPIEEKAEKADIILKNDQKLTDLKQRFQELRALVFE